MNIDKQKENDLDYQKNMKERYKNLYYYYKEIAESEKGYHHNMKKQKFLAIRIDAELHHKIKMISLLEKMSIQQWIEKLIIKNINGEKDGCL